MAGKGKLPPGAIPRWQVREAEQQISNCSADVFLLHQHYIGKEIAGFPL